MYIYIYIYIYIHAYVCMCIYIYIVGKTSRKLERQHPIVVVYDNSYRYSCYVYVYVCIYIYIYIRICPHMCIYIYIYIMYMSTFSPQEVGAPGVWPGPAASFRPPSHLTSPNSHLPSPISHPPSPIFKPSRYLSPLSLSPLLPQLVGSEQGICPGLAMGFPPSPLACALEQNLERAEGARIAVRPITLLRISKLRFLDSNFPGNSLRA